MIQTILRVENNIFPFQERVCSKKLLKVEDLQRFNDLPSLLEKKNQMQKKSQIVNSLYIIKLLNIYQSELTLHYLYENVPYSLAKYVQRHYKNGKQQIIEMSAKLFIKKISYQLTALISYLAKNKIELDLSIENIGLTENQKIKIFMNYRCKMGHKTQISLVALYSSRKEKIIQFIQRQFEQIFTKEETTPNFWIKGNKLVFPTSFDDSQYDKSIDIDRYNGSFNANDSLFYGQSVDESTASCVNPASKNKQPQFNIRQTQSPRFKKKLNFMNQSNNNKSSHSVKKDSKSHKNSFQFGNKYTCDGKNNRQDRDEVNSMTHSKSIRIQLQKKINHNQRKRKDSIKVKVTTFHQYEMDRWNPAEFFGKDETKDGNIFDFFQQKAKADQREECLSERSNRSKQSFDDEFQTPMTPTVRFNHKGMWQNGETNQWQEKVRRVKQKAQSVLSKYLNSKKKTNYTK